MNPMDNGTTQEASQEKTGAVMKAVRRWMMRSSRVSAVTSLSDRFRVIELRGDALRGVPWTPGDKIQVAIGSGFTRRTYTPISWDAATGSVSLVVYLHGNGAGSQWASDVKIGDRCDFSGPRRSLDVGALTRETLLFGDETSFALAAACSGAQPRETQYLFEVEDTIAAQAVIDRLGLRSADVIARQPDSGHYDAISQKLTHFVMDDADVILTGQASTIRHLHHTLKRAGLPASRLRVKAYWAQGKTGLD